MPWGGGGTGLASHIGGVYIAEARIGVGDLMEILTKVEWLEGSEGQRFESARGNRFVRSVDKVLPTLTTLLETAHKDSVLSINVVPRLQGAPLLLYPRRRQEAATM